MNNLACLLDCYVGYVGGLSLVLLGISIALTNLVFQKRNDRVLNIAAWIIGVGLILALAEFWAHPRFVDPPNAGPCTCTNHEQ